MLSTCMTPGGKLVLPTPNVKSIFQVESCQDDEDVLMNIEHVFVGEIKDHDNIVIDTGSSHNLIGRHLLPLLKQKLENAGVKAGIIGASKRFQFGGSAKVLNTAKVVVPLKLGHTRVETEVYIVDTKVPFLLGGDRLKKYKTEISVSDNVLVINNQRIGLKLLPTGHMAIPWKDDIHRIDCTDKVLMTVKVPRRIWHYPEVKEAMYTQMNVLQENGTYEEVQRKPWMKVIPSMWVII